MFIQKLRNIVETDLQKDLEVINQIDNGNGTWTIEIDTYLFKENQFTKDTATGIKYKIIKVNTNDIIIKKSDANVLIYLKCLQPYFFFGTKLEYANYISNENKKEIKLRKRFPTVFVVEGFNYEPEENELNEKISNLTVHLIDKDVYDTNEQRIDNMTYLNKLEKEFIKKLKEVTLSFNYSGVVILNAPLESNNYTNVRTLSIELIHIINECKL